MKKNLQEDKKRISERQKLVIGLILAFIAVTIVFITEQVFKAGYAVKTVVKVISFMGAIGLYCAITGKRFIDVIRLRRIKNIKPIIIWMVFFFAGMTAAFFIFRRFIDLGSIRESLIAKENLTKSNCLFVFAYIILCNSFLEESFFRGFYSGIFPNKRVGTVCSAVVFSLYHIGIFVTWFSPFIFIICIAGLTAVGIFLQWLSDKFESILASYITHACANVVLNIIGALMIFEVI